MLFISRISAMVIHMSKQPRSQAFSPFSPLSSRRESLGTRLMSKPSERPERIYCPVSECTKQVTEFFAHSHVTTTTTTTTTSLFPILSPPAAIGRYNCQPNNHSLRPAIFRPFLSNFVLETWKDFAMFHQSGISLLGSIIVFSFYCLFL